MRGSGRNPANKKQLGSSQPDAAAKLLLCMSMSYLGEVCTGRAEI